MNSINDTYSIHTDKHLLHQLRKNRELKRLLDNKMHLLQLNLFHASLDTKLIVVSQQKLNKLGVDAVYQFRLNTGFRCIFYAIHKTREIILIFVGNHDQVKKFYK